MSKENPLSEAIPDSLNDLMSRSPLETNETEVTAIITELRRMRSKWELGDKTAAKAPKEKNDAIDLSDLGL